MWQNKQAFLTQSKKLQVDLKSLFFTECLVWTFPCTLPLPSLYPPSTLPLPSLYPPSTLPLPSLYLSLSSLYPPSTLPLPSLYPTSTLPYLYPPLTPPNPTFTAVHERRQTMWTAIEHTKQCTFKRWSTCKYIVVLAMFLYYVKLLIKSFNTIIVSVPFVIYAMYIFFVFFNNNSFYFV